VRRGIQEFRAARRDANLAAFAEGGVRNILGALDTTLEDKILNQGIGGGNKVIGTGGFGIADFKKKGLDKATARALARIVKGLNLGGNNSRFLSTPSTT